MARWWDEAERNQVLPLDNRVLWTLAHPKPSRLSPRDQFRYFAGENIPRIANRFRAIALSLRIRAHS